MQDNSTPITNIHVDSWKNPASLGFSTWQRHTALSLATDGGSNPYTLANQYGGSRDHDGFRAIYDRHASFSGSLIARQHLQSTSTADPGRFVYAPRDYASPINKLQRYSYPAAPTLPVVSPPPALLHYPPYHGQYRGVTTAPDAPMISRASGSDSIHAAALHKIGLHGGGARTPSNPPSGHANSDTEAEPRTTAQADPPVSRENPVGSAGSSINLPTGLSIGSSTSLISRIMGGGELSARAQGYPSLVASPLISRRLLGADIIHNPARWEERLHRSDMGAGITTGRSNTEAVSTLNTSLPRPPSDLVHNLSRSHVQRRVSGLHRQSSDGQAFPSTPLITGAAASVARVAIAPVLRHSGGADTFSSPVLPGFSPSRGSMWDTIPHPPIANKIYRKGRQGAAEPGLTVGQQDSVALTHSTSMALSTPQLVENRQWITPSSMQGVVERALPGPVERMQRAQPPTVLRTKRTQDNKEREGDATYREYQVGGLPAVQRSQDKTNPLAAHRRVVTPYLSALPDLAVPSVRSTGKQHTAQLSRASERILQKKPSSLLTARPGSGDSFSPLIQLSRVSPEIAPRLQSFPLSPMSRLSMARAAGETRGAAGEIAAGDYSEIPRPMQILRRAGSRDSPFGRSMQSFSINEGINAFRPAATYRASAIPIYTRSDLLSPAFLPLSRQTGITRFIGTRPVVTGATETDSGTGPVDMRLSLRSYPAIAGSSSSGDLGAASPFAPNAHGHIDSPLQLKPLATHSSIRPVMRRGIGGSAEQQRVSISDGHDISISSLSEQHNTSFGSNHSAISSPHGGSPGFDKRPLVALQRTRDNKVMRVAVQRDAAPVSLERPEDRYGLVSPPGEAIKAESGRAGEANNASTSSAGQADPDEIAERVWQMMAERLVVEQERRGLGSCL